jgi:hypothetical protein
MNHEHHTTPLIWNPFGFMQDFLSFGALAHVLSALAVIAVVLFFCLIVRGRVLRFFALPFFLALAPFIVFSLISYLRFYDVLGSAPPGATIDEGAHEIASIQYPFQFGMLASGALLLLQAFAYGIRRKTRKS